MSEYKPFDNSLFENLREKEAAMRAHFRQAPQGDILAVAFWRFIEAELATGRITDPMLLEESQSNETEREQNLQLDDRVMLRETSAIAVYLIGNLIQTL